MGLAPVPVIMTETSAQWLLRTLGRALVARGRLWRGLVAASLFAAGTALAGVSSFRTGSVSGPQGIAVDRDGHVYVADGGHHRVLKFDGVGTFVGQFGTPGTG